MNNFILAIDPSITQTGVILLNEKGKILKDRENAFVIKTNPKDKDERYFQILNKISALVIVNQPRVLAIETQFYSFNAGSAIKLSKLRGMIIGMYKTILPEGRVIEVSPMTAKSALGVQNSYFKKGTSKEAVRKAVLKIYPELKKSEEDIIDSVAIGIAAYKIIKKI